jgi:hypothetical protein
MTNLFRTRALMKDAGASSPRIHGNLETHRPVHAAGARLRTQEQERDAGMLGAELKFPQLDGGL